MKNRTLRVLSYLLTVCMICTCLPMAAFAVPTAVMVGDYSCEVPAEEAELANETAPQIKNIIFMIPDGAGYGSYDFSNDVKTAGGFDNTKFPYRTPANSDPMTLTNYHAGSVITLNAYNSMTDSAAAGTALATGVKTVNSQLGTDRRKMPHANLTEAALSVGKATGIVSTYEWANATPAAFAVHALVRSDYGDFYRQIENRGFQVVLGAGYGTVEKYGASILNASDNGYRIVNNKAELAKTVPGEKIWGNIEKYSFDFDIYNKETTPTLAEMTAAAITSLSADEDGFFLMVEGSKVDTGGHSNTAHEVVSDYIAFDAAFKVAVDYAKSRNDTIVIAVPDHDTGELRYNELVSSGNIGIAVSEARIGKSSELISWGTTSHSTDNVPFWCYYPEGVAGIEGTKAFGKDNYGNATREEYVIDNTDIAPWLASFMGVDLNELTKELFVDVTDIGVYDTADKKFTFNNGDKYVYKDEGVYYLNGVKTEMEGLAIVIEEKVYVPAEIIDEEDWNFVTEKEDSIEGTGTKDDPFVIDSQRDFLEFTNNMINGETYGGKYLVQDADIDMSKNEDYNGVLSDKSFAGSYDGNGFAVNVNIDTTASSDNAVIFGVNDGVIINLGVTGTVKSSSGYAAFVRKNNGNIANCYSNLDVSSDKLGNGYTISNYGKIENVYFGGFASHNPITGGSNVTNGYYIEGSINASSAKGILVTENEARTTLASTLNEGRASVATLLGVPVEDVNTWYYINGVDYPALKARVPEVTGITLTPSDSTVKRGEAITLKATVLGSYYPSQKVLWEINPAPASKETKIHDDGFFKIGEDETVGTFTVVAKSAVAGNFAISSVVTVDLSSEPVIKEDGSRAHPYLIENEDDFMALTNDLINRTNSYSRKYFKQTADIDMDGYEGYIGVVKSSEINPTYFQGIYDGNGYTINVNIDIPRDEENLFYDTSLFGNIANAAFFNLGVTGSIKSPGYVSTFARNMIQGCVFANCWTTARVESVGSGSGNHPGDASGFVRSPYDGVFVNCYSAGTLISPSGTSYTFGGAGDDYKAAFYNCYYLGQVTYVDKAQSEMSPAEFKAGVAAKLNKDFEGAILAANGNSKGYIYCESMLLPWIDDVTCTRHRIPDDASRFKKEIREDKSYGNLVLASDAVIKANGNKISADSITVMENVSLHLEQGTYVFGNVSGKITASSNANVIVLGESKPEGYVEIDLGDADGMRYMEVNGYQYEISENGNKYGVIVDEELLLQVVDKTGEKYYLVDENGSARLLLLDNYMNNGKNFSIRKPDERTDNTAALRFNAEISNKVKREETMFVVDEYGYIITLEEKLNNNHAQLNFDFEIPGKTAYVSGVGYSRSEGVDKVFDMNDDITVFTAAFYNIPASAYGKRIVAKTYTKITVDGKQYTVYGDPMTTSIYAVAKKIQNDENLSEEMKGIVDGIVEKCEDFDNDLGLDGDDLWN